MREAMIMLISALLDTAIKAMKANSFVGIPSGPTSTTSSSEIVEGDFDQLDAAITLLAPTAAAQLRLNHSSLPDENDAEP